jgi:3-hydroxybutyryl-CoA dehydrogenase
MKMDINDVKNICVVGAGVMGHQISLLCAIHGYKTTCIDIEEDTLKKAEKFAARYLPGRVKKGKMTEEEAEKARNNISFTTDIKEAVRGADYNDSSLKGP